jgi:hypothetical protein
MDSENGLIEVQVFISMKGPWKKNYNNCDGTAEILYKFLQ